MDHRRPLRSIHHDHFEQVPGPIGAEDQVAGRVLIDFLHDDWASPRRPDTDLCSFLVLQ